MSNLKRIETFLQRVIVANGGDPSNPEEKATIKLQSLMEVIKSMTYRVGDDKINEFFRNVLKSLVVEAPEGPLKDLYMKTLNEYNRELNSLLN